MEIEKWDRLKHRFVKQKYLFPVADVKGNKMLVKASSHLKIV